ncbi:hypothetical protein B0F90DRAFT_1741213, partial [Multifurca ochricompacta]
MSALLVWFGVLFSRHMHARHVVVFLSFRILHFYSSFRFRFLAGVKVSACVCVGMGRRRDPPPFLPPSLSLFSLFGYLIGHDEERVSKRW